MNWKLLDIRVGRANRLQYFVITVFFGIIGAAYSEIFKNVFEGTNYPAIFILFLVSLTLIYLSCVPLARRLRDIGYSGKYAWIVFVIYFFLDAFPSLGLIGFPIAVILTFFAGEDGRNQYGPQPQGLDFESMVSEVTPEYYLNDENEDDYDPKHQHRTIDFDASEIDPDNYEFRGRP